MKAITDYSIGSVHQSNSCGEFTIIGDAGKDRNGVHMFHIKFKNTGYEMNTRFGAIRNGTIKDPYYPSVLGIGYLGEPDFDDPMYKQHHQRWIDILHRCYNPNHQAYPMYGGLGVTICEEWKCFATFQHDIEELDGYSDYLKNPTGYQLDKDMKQLGVPKNQTVYSPETCVWLSRHLNEFYSSIKNGTAEGGYYGVSSYFDKPNMFKAHMYHMGKLRVIGVYRTPELAAGAYNCFTEFFYPYLPKNQVKTLTPEELVTLDLRNGRKTMCTIIEQPNVQPSIAAKELTPAQVLAPAMHRFYNQSVEMCRIVNH